MRSAQREVKPTSRPGKTSASTGKSEEEKKGCIRRTQPKSDEGNDARGFKPKWDQMINETTGLEASELAEDGMAAPVMACLVEILVL